MKDFGILSDALNYIELNICESIVQEEVSRACYCSLSHLQKLFSHVFRISIGEYITRRRMTLAARDMVGMNITVTAAAMKYGYNSPEVFARAFIKIWHITPSKFKKTWQFTGIFPRLTLNTEGETHMSKRKFDISELYDYLKSRKGKYVVCFDVVHLKYINDTFGSSAGDKVILECLKRMDTACDDNMLLFRIGGDEFVIVTDYTEKEQVKMLVDGILKQNDTSITIDGNKIPVSMRAGAIRIGSDTLRYGELFEKLQQAPRVKNEVINELSFAE